MRMRRAKGEAAIGESSEVEDVEWSEGRSHRREMGKPADALANGRFGFGKGKNRDQKLPIRSPQYSEPMILFLKSLENPKPLKILIHFRRPPSVPLSEPISRNLGLFLGLVVIKLKLAFSPSILGPRVSHSPIILPISTAASVESLETSIRIKNPRISPSKLELFFDNSPYFVPGADRFQTTMSSEGFILHTPFPDSHRRSSLKKLRSVDSSEASFQPQEASISLSLHLALGASSSSDDDKRGSL
ncbi:uncharacterized protein A4U43_C01F28920 [Asparagus officinalis]|uniref:Uncharacterized protein n=1 Tax=Asparagus officinalis TaxID=4686 RepID=A0A5P1FTK3_ASPOF|nr:uncharacterized protein A4U43_C01F28920 [Asparagus officinalis]